ncbi:pseudouridine synthase [uncultured Halopseudomonas sp.]|uniref:pseudouridine synthase n=1 Tax=uncultured Halopseudomonas sp. TaxID=2901193 RepID=UPI0030EF01BE|tara:strand:+ start:6844 stop:7536 length:693 start_codon:yes stop_codon:yes gene_type:complete
MRLDRLISNYPQYSHRSARQLIASGRVQVNGHIVRDTQATVDRFAAVSIDEQPLRNGYASLYLMLHKPVGYLSATSDHTHPTVLDLLEPELCEQVHIGGRLDRSSSGLLLLTNDGLWSRRVTEPQIKTPKVYHVRTAEPIRDEDAARFAEGIHFAFEGLTTSPAQLQRLDRCEAQVTIYEGRYHQIKRMFHAVGNRVTALHRVSMGSILLDPILEAGEYRSLTQAEVASV